MTRRIVSVILAGLCIMTAHPLPSAADPPPTRPEPPRPPPRPPLRPPPSGPTVAVSVSADGKWVLTGSYTCDVSLWRVGRETPVWTVRATEDGRGDNPLAVLPYGTLAVGFADDGKRALCAWYNGVAEIDLNIAKVTRNTKLPKPVKYYNHEPHALAFLPGSDECVYYDSDERVVRFDFATGKLHPKFDLRLPGVGPLCVKISTDGKRALAYNGGTSYVSEWNLETGELCRSFAELPRAGFQDAGYSGDGGQIWVQRHTLVDGEVRFARERKTGKEAWLPDGLAKYQGWLWFSPDGKYALGVP